MEVQADGASATHCQPTSCCTEMNTIFLCDSAVGKVKMITCPIGLLQYSEKLGAFLKVFGVHKGDESRNNVHNCSAVEAITTLEDVCTFFKRCEREVREFIITTERSLQGPDGVCSVQTMRNLDLTLKTVRNIVALIKRVFPDYLDLSSLTTLVVETIINCARAFEEKYKVLFQLLHKFVLITAHIRDFSHFQSYPQCLNQKGIRLPRSN